MDKFKPHRTWLLAGVLACALSACGGGSSYNMSNSTGGGTSYAVTKLVSDGSGAPYMDANLINAWGLAFNPQALIQKYK